MHSNSVLSSHLEEDPFKYSIREKSLNKDYATIYYPFERRKYISEYLSKSHIKFNNPDKFKFKGKPEYS